MSPWTNRDVLSGRRFSPDGLQLTAKAAEARKLMAIFSGFDIVGDCGKESRFGDQCLEPLQVVQIGLVDGTGGVAPRCFWPLPLEPANAAIGKGEIASHAMPVRRIIIPVSIARLAGASKVEDPVIDGSSGALQSNKHGDRIGHPSGF